jgi:Protein of unknown function (DUF2752)
LASVTEGSRVRRVALPLLSAGAVGLAALALHVRDPHERGSWGFCPFRVLTGLDCPGCGGLRAVNDLTHFDLAGAASSNLLLVLAVPLVAVAWVLWLRRAWRAPGSDRPPLGQRGVIRWSQLAVVVLTAFTVVRNLPVGGWLAA